MVIAIDGPAGAGKSSVARAVADALGYTYLDSGAIYRAVALAALREGTDVDEPAAMGELTRGLRIGVDDGRVVLDGADVTEEVRSPAVTAAASRAAVHPGVRERVVDLQRAMIDVGRYVAEGRDIGTVVSPGAPLKVFLTASDTERARRRAAQTGETVEEVLAAQERRDARDTDRSHAPLRPAEEAVRVDTTKLSLDEVVARVLELARERGLG